MTEQTQNQLYDGLDPEVIERVDTEKRELFSGRSAVKLAAYASAPLAFALGANKAFGQALPQQIQDVLNFALTLEHIEDVFYRTGNGASGLIPGQFKGVFNHIGLHEAEHVALLQSVLGNAAVGRPELDLTAGGKYPDAASNFDTYLTLSQTFEDLGVAAYKGQAGNLISNDGILQTALQIHSVEARHAAIVRKIGGKKPWDGAFDEPLDKQAVLDAAGPFIVSM